MLLRVGGIVLCGGLSRRMGMAKAMLPFGPELMLQRVVRLLSPVASPVAVVAASGQSLPALPEATLVTYDQREGRGPLEGLSAGLSAIAPHADAAYATSCDVPLLVPAFVTRMIALLEDHEVVVAAEGSFYHPLAAVYRTTVLDRIGRLLAEDKRRPVFLFDVADTRVVPVDVLRDVDPELATLRNLNHPADYFSALASAGLEPEVEVRARLNGRTFGGADVVKNHRSTE